MNKLEFRNTIVPYGFYNPERLKGFVQNVSVSKRDRFALRVAGLLTGYKTELKDNATDVYGRRMNGYLALYVTPYGDLARFWKIANFLRGR